MTLVLNDLMPRPGGGYRGARPGVIAAAVERVILEKMLSIGFTAQARMMRNGPSQAAAGWSAAEDGVYKAARALNLLAAASAKIARTYGDDQRFNDDRTYGEITPEPRLETLAQQAIYSTDRHSQKEAEASRLGDEAYQDEVWRLVHENARRHHAYLEATLDRLRRYEPDWLSFDQHTAAHAAAAAVAPRAGREPDEAGHPDRDRANAEAARAEIAAIGKAQIEAARLKEAQRRESEKTGKRVVVAEPPPTPKSGPTPPPAPAPAEPAPPRKRGAQSGNILSLKSGHHTAAARAERAEDSAMLKEVRAFCAEVDDLAEDLRVSSPVPG